jgi:hypothetical protein
MNVEATLLYDRTKVTHGSDVATRAYDRFSITLEERHGFARAWQIAVRLTLEEDRFYDHETGATPRRR